jgi:hypothetical protein
MRRLCLEDQKIAAFGSSYIGMRSKVGAAEGCDLLIALLRARPEPYALR